MAVGKRERVRP